MLLDENKQQLLMRAPKSKRGKLALGILDGYDSGHFAPNIQLMVNELMGKYAEPNKENYPFFSSVFYYLGALGGLVIHTHVTISDDDVAQIIEMQSPTEIRIFIRDHYHIHAAVELREFGTHVISEIADDLFK